MIDPPRFVAIQPSGRPLRAISAGSTRECWNLLVAESQRSIAELRRAGWRVWRDEPPAGPPGATPQNDPGAD